MSSAIVEAQGWIKTADGEIVLVAIINVFHNSKGCLYVLVLRRSPGKKKKYLLWCELMIPDFDENGNLPPGVHWAEWEEFKERFGNNLPRRRMIEGLFLAMTQLKLAGCPTIFIDGSFVSHKQKPGDFDACWEDNGVDVNELKSVAPTLYNFALRRAEQKIKYKGEFFPASYPANDSGTPYIDFFQFDTRTNQRKGIIAIDLQRWKP